MPFYIYILYSETADKYYTGYFKDPWKRFIEPNTVEHLTYTSKFRPWNLKAVFHAGEEKGDVIKMERFIKKQNSKIFLEKLVATDFQPTGTLARLVRVPHVRD